MSTGYVGGGASVLFDIRVIQVLLGHAKLDTTARYTQVATIRREFQAH